MVRFFVVFSQDGIIRRRTFRTQVEARAFRNRALASGIFDDVSFVNEEF